MPSSQKIKCLLFLLWAVCTAVVAQEELDLGLLSEIRDATQRDRQRLDQDALEYLIETVSGLSLEKADELPIDLVRADSVVFRGRMFSVTGRFVARVEADALVTSGMSGVYALLLDTGGRTPVLFLTALDPAGLSLGTELRAFGCFLQLVDAQAPRRLDRAPVLVGQRLIPRFLDWQRQASIDPKIMALTHPGTWDEGLGGFSHTGDMHLGVKDSQGVPLWHLASYALARRQAGSDRILPGQLVSALVRGFQLKNIKSGSVAPGSSQRIIAEFSEAHSVVVGPNPLGVETWTEVFLKVTDLGSKIIPIWIPGEIDKTWRVGDLVDTQSYYFRGYAFVAADDSVLWTPVFVAAALDRYVMAVPGATESFMIWLLFAIALGIVGLFGFWSWRDRLCSRRSPRAHRALKRKDPKA